MCSDQPLRRIDRRAKPDSPDGRNDILAEAAGITAGSWYASPATHVGYELIGAGMLSPAGDGRAALAAVNKAAEVIERG